MQDRPPPMASPTQNAPHWRTAGRAGPSGSPRRTPKRREPPPTRLGPNRDSPLAPRCGKPDPVLDRVAHPYRRSRRCGSKPNRKALLPVPLEQLSGHGEQTGPSPGLGPPPAGDPLERSGSRADGAGGAALGVAPGSHRQSLPHPNRSHIPGAPPWLRSRRASPGVGLFAIATPGTQTRARLLQWPTRESPDPEQREYRGAEESAAWRVIRDRR